MSILEQLTKLPLPPSDALWTHCRHHTEGHQSRTVSRAIGGERFDITIWDWEKYCDGTFTAFPDYCTAQDAVSWVIDQQGIWEPSETTVINDILKEQGEGLVLDVGAHIGWYSLLAALHGHTVAAIEADPDNIQLIQQNARQNRKEIYTFHGYVHANPPVLPVEPVHFLKVDIEGAEPYAYEMCQKLFDEKAIKYALFEISPVFGRQNKYGVTTDTYPDLVEQLAENYDLYQIPTKNWSKRSEFTAKPLDTLRKWCAVPTLNRREYVAGLHQENFLAIAK